MSASAAVNRRTLWILVSIGLFLFVGSILFIISRAS
jgi:hypothetical protein